MILIWLCLVFLEIMHRLNVCVATILCSEQKGAFYWLLFLLTELKHFHDCHCILFKPEMSHSWE